MHIDKLIEHYLSLQATTEETNQLENWLKEDEEHLRYFLHRKNLFEWEHPAFDPQTIDKELAFHKIQARLSPVRRIFPWKRVAAAVALITSIAGGALLFSTRETTVPHQPKVQNIAQVTSAVRLTLPSGEEIVLDSKQTGDIITDSKIVARGDQKQLAYTSCENTGDSVIYHELSVPRGGEYFLELSDKTKIWINAETTVRYPIRFSREERKIFINGEAYLEVHKDSTAPFTVVMPHNEVTVLGTSFNINSYPDALGEQITLVSGKVRVRSGKNGEQITLNPGEQAMILREDGQIVKREVDTNIYCGWKNGVLVFRDNTLEEIFHTVARQYNVEIYWHNETLKQYKFSGELKRYSRIDELLKMIGYTEDVKFTVHDNKIIIAKP